MIRCKANHSIFYRRSSVGCIYLIIYVDDVVLPGSDSHGISQMKHCNQFQTKDLRNHRYFLGIEVTQSIDGIVISLEEICIGYFEGKLVEEFKIY